MPARDVSSVASDCDLDAFGRGGRYHRLIQCWIEKAITSEAQHAAGARWWKAVFVVAVITVAGGVLDLRVAPTNLAMLYLLAVVFVSYKWGFGPALLAALVSTLTFDFVFIRPYLSFVPIDTWYLLTTLTFLCIAVLISVTSTAIREYARAVSRREAHTAALYKLTQALSDAGYRAGILAASARCIYSTFGLKIAIFLRGAAGHLEVILEPPDIRLDSALRSAAEEKFNAAVRSGAVRREGPYLLLKTAQNAIGIMLLTPDGSEPKIGAKDEAVLHAMACQVALAIKRAELEEQAREAEVLRKADELQRHLLSSVSHSLRAPLAAILTAVGSIAEQQQTGTETVVELAHIAHQEAYRLDTLVSNLLDMSRAEAGALNLRPESHDIQNVIGAALKRFQNLGDCEITFDLPDQLPLVRVDFPLIVDVFVNLLDNAVKYSPAGSPIDISAKRVGEELEVCVADRGWGIPILERDAVFGRFARGSSARTAPGLGLGLPICKAFVEAHKGKIRIEGRTGGGTIISFTLPLSSTPEL